MPIPLKAIYEVKEIPHQDSNDILHRNRKNNAKLHIETQQAPNNQGNPEQKEQY
jgi:hypothetical protein